MIITLSDLILKLDVKMLRRYAWILLQHIKTIEVCGLKTRTKLEQMKKEQAILNKIQGKFKSEAHRIEYEKLDQEALKKSLENTQKKNLEACKPVPMRPTYPTIGGEDYNSRSTIRTPFRGYDSIGSYDDGSIEIDISRSTGNSVISEPRFKSKVAESIWRLKNNK